MAYQLDSSRPDEYVSVSGLGEDITDDTAAALSKSVQTLLKSKGFYTGTVDGKFYDKSMQALVKYAASKGFPSVPRPIGYVAFAPILGFSVRELTGADLTFAKRGGSGSGSGGNSGGGGTVTPETPPVFPPPIEEEPNLFVKYWWAFAAAAAVAVGGIVVWKLRKSSAASPVPALSSLGWSPSSYPSIEYRKRAFVAGPSWIDQGAPITWVFTYPDGSKGTLEAPSYSHARARFINEYSNSGADISTLKRL